MGLLDEVDKHVADVDAERPHEDSEGSARGQGLRGQRTGVGRPYGSAGAAQRKPPSEDPTVV